MRPSLASTAEGCTGMRHGRTDTDRQLLFPKRTDRPQTPKAISLPSERESRGSRGFRRTLTRPREERLCSAARREAELRETVCGPARSFSSFPSTAVPTLLEEGKLVLSSRSTKEKG
uniref:Uncharacterized protein n=1 Tax=Chromera velia CCMP2878 TaxID=1169474 RepID=A0A0G4FVG7_9ALVE|eukprot:Cvel_18951.t1-p1 / transcript=Cvel_18951.t1 / gene=Cvel_18951 / organism=Chromera_velia_CCMP2878 / gene_product=hypothetical protein / transcript_product=hypothetical protein / location=Cvel_scaffold1601:29744-31159(+) / protein_length=116 / sequence_SO=supercontig / SO=protein_coding / is_pseudo=false